MTVIWSLLVAIGISLHIFVIMMREGATQTGIEKRQMWKITGVFSAVQLLLQFIGVAITWIMEQFRDIVYFHSLYKAALFLILIELGFSRIRATFKQNSFHERKQAYLTTKRAARLSLKTGGAAVILGMNMYYIFSPLSGILVVVLSVFSALAGFTQGYWKGVAYEHLINILDGGLLTCLALSVVFAV